MQIHYPWLKFTEKVQVEIGRFFIRPEVENPYPVLQIGAEILAHSHGFLDAEGKLALPEGAVRITAKRKPLEGHRISQKEYWESWRGTGFREAEGIRQPEEEAVLEKGFDLFLREHYRPWVETHPAYKRKKGKKAAPLPQIRVVSE
jgi:hypothetical protein